MTKQEFAIKLLFWLMPWPLSKAFPGLLIHILTGPAGPTPHLWAQAVYDILTKFLADATDYAQQLFNIVSVIPPTDQLTTLAAALTTALEHATHLFAILTEMITHPEDYTSEHIWRAFMDTITAMGDLVFSMDALYDAIYVIPPPEPEPEVEVEPEVEPVVEPEVEPEVVPVVEPELEPPLPPPPPLPPLPPPPQPPSLPIWYHDGLAQSPWPWQISSLYPPQKPRPRAQWVVYFDNTYWSPLATNFTWDGTKWVANPATWYPKITDIGTWADGYRPTKLRVTFTGSPDYIRLADSGNHPHYLNASYSSGTEVDLDWTDKGAHVMTDIYSLTVGFMPSATRTITNIEFYEV